MVTVCRTLYKAQTRTRWQVVTQAYLQLLGLSAAASTTPQYLTAKSKNNAPTSTFVTPVQEMHK